MKKYVRLLLLLAVLAAVVVYLVWGNTALQLTEIAVKSDDLPEAFQGFRIAQVSDLHNAEFGQGNETLLELLAQADPDIIALTGDLVDSRSTNIEVALAFIREAVKIAPCYYVTGNHESRIGEYDALEWGLREAGVTVLRNEAVTLEQEGQTVRLLGVDDPAFNDDWLLGDEAYISMGLDALKGEGYTILLSHRPELFDIYCQKGMDLVLSGHAHGGQFRLPFIGGIIAPNQGLFPAYDAGLYASGGTAMVVSRGIGNSIIPLRINNPPEVILITLTT